MKKRFLALALVLGVCLGLAAPASAYDMGHVGRNWALSCGYFNTAVVKTDGSLWAWGEADYALGNAEAGNVDTVFGRSLQTVPIKVMDDVAAVSYGMDHSAAIKTDGSLWVWGNNYYGQLGNGTCGSDGIDTAIPVKVMDGVAAVSCGYEHTAAIKTDGSLWMWGSNEYGQLGNGGGGNVTDNTYIVQSTPVKVMDEVVAVSCGKSNTAAIKSDGSLWVWGYAEYVNGQGNATNDVSVPIQTVPYRMLDQVAEVSCGDNHIAAVKTDGSLWLWGANYAGQLGNGTTEDSGTPVKVLDNVATVSCSPEHTAAVKKDGTLWIWGSNEYGQLGNGGGGNAVGTLLGWGSFPAQTVPIQVMENVVAVSCGIRHTVAIQADGSLWAWGDSSSGQLGNGIMEADSLRDPIQTPVKVLEEVAVPGNAQSLPATVGTFTDVLETDFFAAPVEWAVENGVTSGTSETTFSPGNTCTTAEILTFLWRASGSPAPVGTNPFSDVAESDFSYQAALWAYENGLVSGTALQGSAPCTRADTVTYLWKLAGSPAAPAASFTDVPAGADYAPAVAWAVDQGVTSGTGEGAFSPDNTCTRGEIVTFLYRGLGQ